MLIKCKICGGEMFADGKSALHVCEYCGTKQTVFLPGADELARLYNRANAQRLEKDYAHAQQTYAQIVREKEDEAEAYWGLVLSRYGIEYVRDPASGTNKPTIHRTQFESLTADADYEKALKYATEEAKAEYSAEAARIEAIRERYLQVVSHEEPYDLFICYKETDSSGERTKDSVIAQEIYQELTVLGYRVFFSRISLENKLGEDYEPYIFAALNSAAMMLVVATEPENLDAAWVRNEWQRYLFLMKQQQGKKMLLAVYSGMEEEDLPEAFLFCPNQDYDEPGALQELVRGVEKVTGRRITPEEEEKLRQDTPEKRWKRAEMLIASGAYEEADGNLEKGLDLDPRYAPLYIGKLLCKLKLHSKEELSRQMRDLEEEGDWRRACRFAADAQAETFESISAANRKNMEMLPAYREALASMPDFLNPDELGMAVDVRRVPKVNREELINACIKGWNDAADRFEALREYGEGEAYYQLCVKIRNHNRFLMGVFKMDWAKNEEAFRAAESIFESLAAEYAPAAEMLEKCRGYTAKYNDCVAAAKLVRREMNARIGELQAPYESFEYKKALADAKQDGKKENESKELLNAAFSCFRDPFIRSYPLEIQDYLYRIAGIYENSGLNRTALYYYLRILDYRDVKEILARNPVFNRIWYASFFNGATVFFGRRQGTKIYGEEAVYNVLDVQEKKYACVQRNTLERPALDYELYPGERAFAEIDPYKADLIRVRLDYLFGPKQEPQPLGREELLLLMRRDRKMAENPEGDFYARRKRMLFLQRDLIDLREVCRNDPMSQDEWAEYLYCRLLFSTFAFKDTALTASWYFRALQDLKQDKAAEALMKLCSENMEKRSELNHRKLLLDSPMIRTGQYRKTKTEHFRTLEWFNKPDRRYTVMLCMNQIIRRYHHTNEPVAWKDSELFRWLNSEFLTEAFPKEARYSLLAQNMDHDGATLEIIDLEKRHAPGGAAGNAALVSCPSAAFLKTYFTAEERKMLKYPTWTAGNGKAQVYDPATDTVRDADPTDENVCVTVLLAADYVTLAEYCTNLGWINGRNRIVQAGERSASHMRDLYFI